MSLPIRLRIALAYGTLLALIVTALGAFVVVRLRADLVAGMDRELQPAAAQIALDYGKEGLPEFSDSAGTVLKGERAAAQLLAPDGHVIAVFGDPVAARAMVPPAAADGLSRRLGAPPQAFRLTVRPTQRKGQSAFVVAGESLAPVERSVRRVRTLLLIAGPAALLLTGVGGWWLARRALRPVDAMTTTAAAIGVERLDDRVPEPATRDELWHLARTLNTMLDRIGAGVAEQRRLVADASHELRTPLAAMRAEIDVSLRADGLPPAARDVLESAREEVDRLNRLVDDLLTLASADEGLALEPQPVDLGELAAQVALDLRPLAERRNVTVELSGAPAPVSADRAGLSRALRNVVENAIEFSPAGGCVRIFTAPGRVQVADEGPGVPPELRERIFDRFFRADPSRDRQTGGTGLGLAIARELVNAHGGTIRAEPTPSGSVFIIELPDAFNVLSEPAPYGATRA
jgi:two-component system, OmpR family, sensor kinase